MSATGEFWNAAKELVATPLDDTRAQRLDSLLNAAMETAADELPSADGPRLGQVTVSAKALLSLLMSRHSIDETSPDFLAGRVAALVDLYGYAAAATADAEVSKLPEDELQSAVFDAVANGLANSVAISEEVGTTLDEIKPALAELCCAGLLVKFRHGADVIYSLSPIGSLLADKAATAVTLYPSP